MKVYVVYYTYWEPYAVVMITTDAKLALATFAHLSEDHDDYWVGEYTLDMNYGKEGKS